MLINSEKGIFLLDSCKKRLEIHEGDLEHAIKNNPCIVKPVNKPKGRDKFFDDFNSKEFSYVIKKYMSPPSFIEKQVIFAKRGINFIRKKAKRFLSSDNNNK
ncbi:hypothetical protein [Petrotoga sp. 9PWA.NaAc.5.4]|uniref:hypothetical protein n=1 Tax=Petrotoga sp. 9PWA.NaAc.5.4 TaxID=1434328 RepID=UPI000CAD4FF8|nr:hypothetical protein X924_08205 [Petrotoga sp. 9PWA.NaAc.5.4]